MTGPSMTPDHIYTFTHTDGRVDGPYPSVTSLKPAKDFGWWQAKLAAERAIDTWGEWVGMGDRRDAIAHIAGAADDHRNNAADIGTRAHAWCEQRAAGTVSSPDEDIVGHAEQFEQFLARWKPRYLYVEQVVFSPTHRYAGTFDAIAEIDGLGTVMLDIKTGKRVYGDVALQLAAYANADWMGLEDGTTQPVPRIDNYMVLHLRPRSHHLIPITVTNPDTFRAFLYSAEVHRFNATADRLVGPPILPSLEAL